MTDDELKADLTARGWELHPVPEWHVDFPFIRAEKWFPGVGKRETGSDRVSAVHENALRFEDLHKSPTRAAA